MSAARLGKLAGLFLVSLALSIGYASANAQQCASGCTVGRGICTMQARTARAACLRGCATGDMQCHSACMTAMRSAHATCRGARTDCMTTCPGIPAGTTAACAEGCGATAKQCFADTFAAGRTCVQSCKAAGGTGVMSCLVQCAVTMERSRLACVTAFQQCLSGCPEPTPPAQCSSEPCGGRCVIAPNCPPGVLCPAFVQLGQCVADATGACGCAPVSPPPTRTPQPTPTPQCAAAMCGGACTIGIPFPCADGEVCNGPNIPVLQGQCTTSANGDCECLPVRPTPPTPRATPTPQCGGPVCGGRCVIAANCPAGKICPEAELVTRPGECTADAAGACQCVPVAPPTRTPLPSPTPQCGDAAACGGPCTIGVPFPCADGTICPNAIALQRGECEITAAGSCDCVPVEPTPRATATPQCSGATCGGACLVAPNCPPGAPCPANALVVRRGECTADADGSCQCVAVGSCGSEADGSCGGSCPLGASCESVSGAAAACQCVSGPGGPCGGNILAPPPICAPGLVCHQSSPDIIGYCEKPDCVPLFTSGCSQTADCCEPCENGTHAPCGVCSNGTCEGAP